MCEPSGVMTLLIDCWLPSTYMLWSSYNPVTIVQGLRDNLIHNDVRTSVVIHSAFHKLGYISSGSKGSIIEPLDLNWIERASSVHRAGIERASSRHRAGIEQASSGVDAYIERTRWDIEQERSCDHRARSSRIQSARPVFLPIKKERPQECRISYFNYITHWGE